MIPDIIQKDIDTIGAVLFGSRSMAARPAKENFDPTIMIGAHINASTDWDFSQQYSTQAHDYLVSVGFECYKDAQLSPYADSLTKAVYIKSYCSFPRLHIVNVVLHKDEALFRQVWDCIDPEFYYRYLWKRSPHYDYTSDLGEIKTRIKEIMNQLYAVAKSVER